MKFWNQIFILLISYISNSIALEDIYDVETDVILQSCALVANYENSKVFWISESFDPSIEIKLLSKDVISDATLKEEEKEQHITQNTQEEAEAAELVGEGQVQGQQDKEHLKIKRDAKNLTPLEQLKQKFGGEGWTLEAALVPGSVLNRVKMNQLSNVKVCDATAVKKGFCTFGEDTNDFYIDPKTKKGFEKEKINVFEKTKKNTELGINNFKFNKIEDNTNFHIDNTDIYCLLLSLKSVEKTKIKVAVNWQHSYGNLVVSHYSFLYIYGIIFALYFISSIIYSYYLFIKFENDKTSGVYSIRNKIAQSVIQFKILIFMFGTSIEYFLLEYYYILINRHGYLHNSFYIAFVHFITLTLSTIFSVWVIYNIMLICSGWYILNNKKDANSSTITKISSLLLLISLVIFDLHDSTVYSILSENGSSLLSNLIYFEYLVIFSICGFWIFNTYKSLKSNNKNSISEKILVSSSLILLPILFNLILKFFVQNNYIHERFQRVVQLSSYSYIFTFIITIIIAYIWKDSVFQNGEVSIKQH
ncbi:hypothetical protein B5S33_g150 [[Candida] boidinii]|nr:hypothetical protein B5S33_g150 [[Candida] boidinii]